MSTVELAVEKVQSLSDTLAQALLDWLAQQETARRAPQIQAQANNGGVESLVGLGAKDDRLGTAPHG